MDFCIPSHVGLESIPLNNAQKKNMDIIQYKIGVLFLGLSLLLLFHSMNKKRETDKETPEEQEEEEEDEVEVYDMCLPRFDSR